MPPNTVPNPSEPSQDPLRAVVGSGLLRCGVPSRLGGDGRGLDALAGGAADLAHHQPATAWVLWAQRLAIEALLQSPNVALREHWLADFLSGERAATLSPAVTPLQAHDTGRGWLLRGEQRAVPNLPWAGFSLVVPLRLHEPQPHWVLLRSEEDGLSILRDTGVPDRGDTATLQLNQVFFREDEWLCGPELPQRLLPVAQALGRGLAYATDWNPDHTPTLSP